MSTEDLIQSLQSKPGTRSADQTVATEFHAETVGIGRSDVFHAVDIFTPGEIDRLEKEPRTRSGDFVARRDADADYAWGER